MNLRACAGTCVLLVDADGPILAEERDWVDLIGEALGNGAEWIAVPATRLDERFFRLSTCFAGEAIQKVVNYRLRLAIVGEISAHVAASNALTDFVRESNRGGHVWFVEDWDMLEERLTRR
jgi:hypothetical protein